MPYFNIVAQTSENTVVTEYEPVKARSDSYQSEAELEREFIRMLTGQGYEYLPIHSEAELIANLRNKLEMLNSYSFSDSEWDRFFKDALANPNDHIVEKTRKIQEDFVQVLKRDDGSTKNITLIDKKNIHNNLLQVINQYAVSQDEGARHSNRYDVTILVNGLPMIHVELKRRGVVIREAFNQIDRYQRDSFWAGSGLFEYVQIFVISNGTNTKYYSNSTRFNAIKDAKSGKQKKEKTSNSFEFTCFWADANNRVIPDLIDFTRTFFARHTILNILTKYCIFTSENMLMVMRPYQITATERILNRIEIANNYKKYGTLAGGGYIWHTTGSGKTLTSFKTARQASQLPYIDKVLFVVDRKDLDYKAIKIPRTEVAACDRDDIKGVGVYFLICQEDDGTDSVYIGEAENVLDRLAQHLRDYQSGKEKYYWNTAVIFVGRDLNKALIRYLENRFVEIAKDCGRYAILTKNTYKNTVLKEAQIASMEEFIDNVKILINTLGYKVLVPVPKASDDTVYLYCKGAGASAKGFVSAGGFTVLEGSIISDHTVPSLETKGKTYFKLRNNLIKDGVIIDRAFTRDYEFNAPSAASAVILGHTSNGNVDWKTSDGTKLKDL